VLCLNIPTSLTQQNCLEQWHLFGAGLSAWWQGSFQEIIESGSEIT